MNYTLSSHLPDRQSTGDQLSQKLQRYINHPQAIVSGIPAGGMSIAEAMAPALKLPQHICLVRKLTLPHHPTVTIGAIAANCSRVLNYDVINGFGVSQDDVDRITSKALKELQQCHHDRPQSYFQDKIWILVDDGIETAASVRTAIAQLSIHQPAKIILAVPAISAASRKHLKSLVDEFIDLAPPGSIDDRRQSSEEMTHVREVQVVQRRPQAAMPGQLRAHSPQLVEV